MICDQDHQRDAERELVIMSVDGRGVPRWGKNSLKRSEGGGLARRSAARSRKLIRSSMEVPFWLIIASDFGDTWEMSD